MRRLIPFRVRAALCLSDFNFHVDAGRLFCLLFVISMCAFVENVNRNVLRNDCRQFTRDYNSSKPLRGLDRLRRGDEFPNVTEWLRFVDSEDRCGYSAIEPGFNTDVPEWLLGAMGTCTEITNPKPNPNPNSNPNQVRWALARRSP